MSRVTLWYIYDDSIDGVNGKTWVGTVGADGGQLSIPVVKGAVVDFYCLSWDSYNGVQYTLTINDFHPKSCRRPLQFLPCSSRCPRAAGSESLKCSFFTFPLREICFKMSVCSRSVFYGEVLRKWLRLEFLSPYLRLFSFCDYTIAHA